MDLFTLTATLTLDTAGYTQSVNDAISEAGKLKTAFGGIESGTETASRGIGDVEHAAYGFGDTVKGILTSNLIQDAARGVWDLASSSVTLASDLEEVQNVVDVTFGAGAAQINSWAQTTSQAFGVSELNAKYFSGTMGAMFKSMGIGENQALNMAMAVTELAGDMASFYNLDHSTAFQKIQSGMAGEVEPLRQLGINMTVANLEAYALANGIQTAYTEMSQAEQATLRYNYLLSTTANAQGDFARTSDQLANSTRTLGNNIDSLKAKAGEAFIPIAEGFTNTLNAAFEELNTQSVEEMLGAIDSSMTVSASNITYTANRARNLAKVLETLGPATERTEQQQAQWAAIVAELSREIPTLSSVINQGTGEITGGTDALTASITAWEEAAQRTVDISSLEAKANLVADIEGKIAAENTALANAQALMQVAMDDTMVIGTAVASKLNTSFDGTADGFREMMNSMAAYYAALELGFTDQDITEALTAYDEAAAAAQTHQENLVALQSDYEAAKTSMDTTASGIETGTTDMETSVTNSLGEVEQSTNDMIDNLDQAETAKINAKATGDGVTAGLEEAYPAFETAANKYIDKLTALGNAADDAVGSASGAASGAGRRTYPKYAVGLDYVPSDEYMAELHRGEAVLTRSEAEEWRAGEGGRGTTINVYQSIYSEAKTAAELMREARWEQERGVMMGYVYG